MKAYSLDLRHRVLEAALNQEHTIGEVAELFGVGTTFVNKMLRLHRSGQDLAPRPHDGGQTARLSGLEQVAEERGARVLWLPPYSPDYSPIENCWSKIKTAVRAAKARTRDELAKALAIALQLVTKTDIQGWFIHCGYSVTRK